MAAPANEPSRYDAMYDWAGRTIFNLVRDRFNPHTDTILDVGAGWGKYGYLLPDFKMDACEIWGPYIEEDMLWKKYRHVIQKDICDVDFTHEQAGRYSVIILGDVLEHIEEHRAKKLIVYLLTVCDELVVAVPYKYRQDAGENPFEEHKQNDLTPEIMEQRYPGLRLHAMSTDAKKGVYIRR